MIAHALTGEGNTPRNLLPIKGSETLLGIPLPSRERAAEGRERGKG